MEIPEIDYTDANRKQLVREQLAQHVLYLSFRKSNGDLRHMRATLNSDLFEYQHSGNVSSSAGPFHDQVQAVWDLDAQGWRSFRWERLVSCQLFAYHQSSDSAQNLVVDPDVH